MTQLMVLTNLYLGSARCGQLVPPLRCQLRSGLKGWWLESATTTPSHTRGVLAGTAAAPGPNTSTAPFHMAAGAPPSLGLGPGSRPPGRGRMEANLFRCPLRVPQPLSCHICSAQARCRGRPVLKGRGLSLYFLMGGALKNPSAYFKTTAGLRSLFAVCA